MIYIVCFIFFFFQAEDGIRDGRVTGVQTCALPISDLSRCSDERAAAVPVQAAMPIPCPCPESIEAPAAYVPKRSRGFHPSRETMRRASTREERGSPSPVSESRSTSKRDPLWLNAVRFRFPPSAADHARNRALDT